MKRSRIRGLVSTCAVASAGLAAVVACGSSYSAEEAPATNAAPDAAPDTSLPPPPPPGMDAAPGPDAAADADAASPPKPAIDTILTGIDDAIDFDVRPTDLVLLRTTPSRIESCPSGVGAAGASCTALVASGSMPTDADAGTQAGGLSRANASLAYVGSTVPPALLLAQGGKDSCAINCTADDGMSPGLYRIALGAVVVGAPQRVSTTVPLFAAKAYRSTNGWLVGRGTSFAVEQVHNNESFTIQGTSTFTVTNDAVDTRRYERGFNGGPAQYLQPFVFAAATTSNGAGGYVAGYNDLVDAVTYTATGIIPVTAAATATDGNGDLFARAANTANDVVLTLRTLQAQTLLPAKIPGVTTGRSLFATASYVGFYDPAAPAPTLHVCRVTAVRAGTCTPTDVALPLTGIVRMRAVGDALWVLGPAAGKPTIVRVTLPP